MQDGIPPRPRLPPLVRVAVYPVDVGQARQGGEARLLRGLAGEEAGGAGREQDPDR